MYEWLVFIIEFWYWLWDGEGYKNGGGGQSGRNNGDWV